MKKVILAGAVLLSIVALIISHSTGIVALDCIPVSCVVSYLCAK